MARNVFPELVHLGPDSWGWASWNGSEIETQKRYGRCDSEYARRATNIRRDAQWWIGHTRLATHGSPTDMRNNHPIEHGRIVGVHNGIISNYKAILDKTGRQDEDTQVDSEAIFASVNMMGHRNGLAAIKGDMVAAYADTNIARTINVVRAYGRPLWLAATKAGSIMFASERKAIVRSGLDLAEEPWEVRDNFVVHRLRQGRIVEKFYYNGTKPKPIRSYIGDSYVGRAAESAKVFEESDEDIYAYGNGQVESVSIAGTGGQELIAVRRGPSGPKKVVDDTGQLLPKPPISGITDWIEERNRQEMARADNDDGLLAIEENLATPGKIARKLTPVAS